MDRFLFLSLVIFVHMHFSTQCELTLRCCVPCDLQQCVQTKKTSEPGLFADDLTIFQQFKRAEENESMNRHMHVCRTRVHGRVRVNRIVVDTTEASWYHCNVCREKGSPVSPRLVLFVCLSCLSCLFCLLCLLCRVCLFCLHLPREKH